MQRPRKVSKRWGLVNERRGTIGKQIRYFRTGGESLLRVSIKQKKTTREEKIDTLRRERKQGDDNRGVVGGGHVTTTGKKRQAVNPEWGERRIGDETIAYQGGRKIDRNRGNWQAVISRKERGWGQNAERPTNETRLIVLR